MLETNRSIRIAAVVTGVVALAIAFGVRAVFGGALYSNGALQQNTGTALYASAVYAAVVFVAPRCAPFAAGAMALAWCWGVEAFQLTGVPHELSKYHIMLRLIFGDAFDWLDVLWYPAGILPLVLVELFAKVRSR
ncbi:DUF2809 domain-containing protein [Dactylosporangium sp. NPDC051541]|uniref:DUF2809 domain-containing protein n=1 Tax=Dactylosporangium sp. NPDC051541 TaxID=3363977 RepID=UPI0037A172D7